MALTVSGRVGEASAAYGWLAADPAAATAAGSTTTCADSVKDARLDTNVCAYLAAGRLALRLRDRRRRLRSPGSSAMVESRARLRAALPARRRHDPLVASTPTGRPEGYALLTGSSSIFHALRCGGRRWPSDSATARPAWELAAGRLGHAVAHHPGAFAPKNEFAMDWYYPVLCGALAGDAAAARLDAGWERHVLDGLGVRCVSTSDWVTAAETAECAIALDALGRRDGGARRCSPRRARTAARTAPTSPASPTPARATFPGDETTSYTAAAVCWPPTRSARSSAARGSFAASALPRRLDLPRAAAAARRPPDAREHAQAPDATPPRRTPRRAPARYSS